MRVVTQLVCTWVCFPVRGLELRDMGCRLQLAEVLKMQDSQVIHLIFDVLGFSDTDKNPITKNSKMLAGAQGFEPRTSE
jgi:hypothetical protein